MNVITLTLNPAFDIHADAPELWLRQENLAQVRSREAGGKGVNISRALTRAGINNTALVVLGRENGKEFRDALEADGVRGLYLERPGRIRENLTVHTEDGTETRISFSGFSVDETLLDEVANALPVEESTVVTFTGRIPSGISLEQAVLFLNRLKKQGVKLVLDSKSLPLETVCQLRPWLIKPNQDELGEFFGCQIRSREEAMEKGRFFSHAGVENVMLSLGADGAMLLRQEGTWIAQTPKIRAVSTIGAGDSTVAGFLAGTDQGKTPEECLKMAVAFGTAACLTPGSQPPVMADAERLMTQIQIKKNTIYSI